MSNASIARQIGVSEGTVIRRPNLLKERDIIDRKVVLNSNYLNSETKAVKTFTILEIPKDKFRGI